MKNYTVPRSGNKSDGIYFLNCGANFFYYEVQFLNCIIALTTLVMRGSPQKRKARTKHYRNGEVQSDVPNVSSFFALTFHTMWIKFLPIIANVIISICHVRAVKSSVLCAFQLLMIAPF